MKNLFNRIAAGFVIGIIASLTIIGGTEFANTVFYPQARAPSIERYSYSQIPGAHATALTDFGENKSLDALLRAQAIGTPATWYIALFTDTCTDAGPGTEVSTSGTAYARQAVTASLANWAGTQSAGSTTASSGTGGTTSNNNAITWSASTAAWGNVQSVGWMDASTAGNRWICINLTAALNVTGAGFTVTFAAGQLTFQIDN